MSIRLISIDLLLLFTYRCVAHIAPTIFLTDLHYAFIWLFAELQAATNKKKKKNLRN